MVAEQQLIAGEYGDSTQIEILKADGTVDDLTVYDTIRLILSTIDFSTNIYNLTGTDPEINLTQASNGILFWTPSKTKPVPAVGDYWLQIFRESELTMKNPSNKFFIQVTRGATEA